MIIACNGEVYKIEVSEKRKQCYLFFYEPILIVSFYKYKEDLEQKEFFHRIEFTKNNYLSLNKKGYRYISRDKILALLSFYNKDKVVRFFKDILEYLIVNDLVY